MKFIHLGDLHIGKRVHEHPMIDEQRHAFAQITRAAQDNNVDAVLIAGDVFDRSVPSKDALELAEELYAGFINLGIPVYAIPGNHDSAQQVSYCSSITAAAGLHIAKAYSGTVETYRMHDAYGPVDIHLLPFVRPTDVRMALQNRAGEISTHDDAVHVALDEHLKTRPLDPCARNVLVAHQFVVNGSDKPGTCDSETVNVGGIDSVQAAHFDAFDYVALGHLHGSQHVRRPEVRYCGSPLKYSFSEARQKKTISLVELGGADGRTVSLTELPLTPLHEMREITAAFDDVLAGSDTGNHADYMHIVLTDRTAYDAFNRLRALYPNLLRLDWADTYSVSDASNSALASIKRQSIQELFGGFYEKQTGAELSAQERAIIDDVVLSMEGGTR